MPTLRDLKIALAIAVISCLSTLVVTFVYGSTIEHGLLVLAAKFGGATSGAIVEAAPVPAATPQSRSPHGATTASLDRRRPLSR